MGYEPERSPARLRVPLKKAWLLHESLRWLVAQPTVYVEDLRAAVGVWIWAALLARHWLALPYNVFQFMNSFERRRVPWWESARHEVRVMSWAVMGLYADLGAPFSPLLFATDAEGPTTWTTAASAW